MSRSSSAQQSSTSSVTPIPKANPLACCRRRIMSPLAGKLFVIIDVVLALTILSFLLPDIEMKEFARPCKCYPNSYFDGKLCQPYSSEDSEEFKDLESRINISRPFEETLAELDITPENPKFYQIVSFFGNKCTEKVYAKHGEILKCERLVNTKPYKITIIFVFVVFLVLSLFRFLEQRKCI